ncbi:hypothetical protein TNCV_490751 [Trichonephila clavipes]|nr:hypothetical protein TNCV_490751 [Trichonephila clavipes]
MPATIRYLDHWATAALVIYILLQKVNMNMNLSGSKGVMKGLATLLKLRYTPSPSLLCPVRPLPADFLLYGRWVSGLGPTTPKRHSRGGDCP